MSNAQLVFSRKRASQEEEEEDEEPVVRTVRNVSNYRNGDDSDDASSASSMNSPRQTPHGTPDHHRPTPKRRSRLGYDDEDSIHSDGVIEIQRGRVGRSAQQQQQQSRGRGRGRGRRAPPMATAEQGMAVVEQVQIVRAPVQIDMQRARIALQKMVPIIEKWTAPPNQHRLLEFSINKFYESPEARSVQREVVNIEGDEMYDHMWAIDPRVHIEVIENVKRKFDNEVFNLLNEFISTGVLDSSFAVRDEILNQQVQGPTPELLNFANLNEQLHCIFLCIQTCSNIHKNLIGAYVTTATNISSDGKSRLLKKHLEMSETIASMNDPNSMQGMNAVNSIVTKLVQILESKGFRRNGDYIAKEKILNDGTRTHYWECNKSIEEFVLEQCSMDNDVKLFQLSNDSSRVIPSVVENLTRRNYYSFTQIDPQKNAFSFVNGIWLSEVCVFVPYALAQKVVPKEFVTVNYIDHELVCVSKITIPVYPRHLPVLFWYGAKMPCKHFPHRFYCKILGREVDLEGRTVDNGNRGEDDNGNRGEDDNNNRDDLEDAVQSATLTEQGTRSSTTNTVQQRINRMANVNQNDDDEMEVDEQVIVLPESNEKRLMEQSRMRSEDKKYASIVKSVSSICNLPLSSGEVYGYTFPAYNGSTQMFEPGTPEQKFEASYEDAIDLKQRLKEYIEAPLDWIMTPAVEKLLDSQNLPRDAKAWDYAMNGRCYSDVNKYDEFHVGKFYIGVAGSGKSTILNIVCEAYPKSQVQTISSKTEKTFGLENLYRALLVACSELNTDLQLSQTDFNSMISGENMQICRKNKTAITVQWKPAVIMSGNSLGPWGEMQGAASRRIFGTNFCRAVARAQGGLFDEAKSMLPDFIVKCTLLYYRVARRHGRESIWTVCPKYFCEVKFILRCKINSVAACLNTDMFIRRQDGYMYFEDFKKEYKDWCSKNSKKPKPLISSDDYESLFTEMELFVVDDTRQWRGAPVRGQFVDGITFRDASSSHFSDAIQVADAANNREMNSQLPASQVPQFDFHLQSQVSSVPKRARLDAAARLGDTRLNDAPHDEEEEEEEEYQGETSKGNQREFEMEEEEEAFEEQ